MLCFLSFYNLRYAPGYQFTTKYFLVCFRKFGRFLSIREVVIQNCSRIILSRKIQLTKVSQGCIDSSIERRGERATANTTDCLQTCANAFAKTQVPPNRRRNSGVRWVDGTKTCSFFPKDHASHAICSLGCQLCF